MIEIHFQRIEDAKRLYCFLRQQLSLFNPIKEYNLHFEESYIVRCSNKQDSKDELLTWFKMSLCQFIMNIKLNDWLKHILSAHFYYHNEEEQQQIIDIVHSVLEGKRTELNAFLPKINVREHIMTEINEWYLDQPVFSFDSFVAFRLRSFLDKLKKYVELSLDEYKLEQEYQMFIQTLRDFLRNREPKIHHLHLLLNDMTTFFDSNYSEMKRSELIDMVDRKLLINHPVYVDSVTIAPLLSIAPKKIYLYTNDLEQPLVRTIQNIFEERLISNPITAFAENKRMFSTSYDKKR